MKNKLKIIRIAAAALLFVLFTAAAIGFQPLDALLVTQFGPGILRLTAGFFAGTLAAVVVILGLTLCFGRIYCSVLCPLGILQDGIMALTHRKRAYAFHDTRPVKYGIFLFIAILAACGVTLPLVLLLPSSNFFTIVTNAFLPVFGRAANTAGVSIGSYTVNPPFAAFVLAWAVFAVLFALSAWRGRIYCNTLCPVGAVLSIPAKFSLYRITLSQDQCVSCGLCAKVCKAGAIDAKKKSVLAENCVMCFNCISACKRGGVKLEFRPKTPKFNLSRRHFIGGAAGLAAGAGALALASKLERTLPPAATPPAMPPGAGSLARFNNKCVGCGVCIRVCDGKVLAPSISQYGLAGFLQPYMDYSRGFCTFDCNACSNVCPAGALLPLPLPVKQTTRIGLAAFDPTKCIAFLTGIDCGACAEHCPIGALDMIPFNDTRVPCVNQDLCIGCGACQHICPADPGPAIVVEALAEQIRVEKPESTESETLKAEEEFPF